MPLDYGTGVDEEALRRARNEGLFYAGLSLLGNPNDLGTAVGDAARSGFGAHRESVERSAQQAAGRAEKEEADQDELDELNRRIEAVKSAPQEVQGKLMPFIHSPDFWDLAAEQGFPEPEEGYTLGPGQSRFKGSEEIARVEPKEPGGFTLSGGQTRFDAQGNPIASVADAGGEDEFEPYAFQNGKLWYTEAPGAQPVPINGPEELPNPADQVKAVTAAADKVYTMAMKEWEAITESMEGQENKPPPPKYQTVYDEVEREMFGGPVAAKPGRKGRINEQAIPAEPPPDAKSPRDVPATGEPPAFAEPPGAPPVAAAVTEIQKRQIPRATAVARARAAFGDAYADALDKALADAGL